MIILLSGMGQAANTFFPVKATTRGLGTDLRYYEPTAKATFRVVWRLEWNGMEARAAGIEQRRFTLEFRSEVSRFAWPIPSG